MNIVALTEAKSRLTEIGRRVQGGRRALVTRRGKPFFIVLGVEGDDLLEVLIRWDPDFWKDLERRRRRSRRRSVSLEEFEREVGGATSRGGHRRPTGPGSSRRSRKT